ncbi:uncharacterized protein [Ambystoma mexicanum]|uniref:uncharacterized protein isoform X2 n=1 Tax=Ambystoma mexicanum TaxID=8296 RepID=UPI0037E958F1
MARLADATIGPHWMATMVAQTGQELPGSSQVNSSPLMFQDSASEEALVEIEVQGEEEEDREEEVVQSKRRKRTMTAKAKANKEQSSAIKKPRGKGRAQEDAALPAPTPAEAPGNCGGPPSTPATRPVDVAVEDPTSLEMVTDGTDVHGPPLSCSTTLCMLLC